MFGKFKTALAFIGFAALSACMQDGGSLYYARPRNIVPLPALEAGYSPAPLETFEYGEAPRQRQRRLSPIPVERGAAESDRAREEAFTPAPEPFPPEPRREPEPEPEPEEPAIGYADGKDKLRIAVLAPMSSKHAAVGAEIRNAASMAMFNAKMDNVIIQFYDTEGTADAAREAILRAEREGADVAVGPLLKEEVEGVKDAGPDIPVISFTTDIDALGRNVFSIGHLIDSQVKRVVQHAALQGRKTMVLVTPDSISGKYVRKRVLSWANRYDIDVAADETFERRGIPDLIRKITNFDERAEEYRQYAESVNARLAYLAELKADFPEDYGQAFDAEQYQSSDAELAALETLKAEAAKRKTFGKVDFDAVFAYGDDINDVIMIGSMMMYYEVPQESVRFMGTNQLDNPKVFPERAFKGAWYPTVSTKYGRKFDEAYSRYFKAKPGKIASLTFDAIAVAANIFNANGSVTASAILNPNGWTGINGVFRFATNGENERLMDITEIRDRRPAVASPAASSF
jgi:ABC-type branched-subunit amino acid transport system substrate-binding protein